MEEGNPKPLAAYTNFGADTAGPLTPPTLPFGFGKAAFRSAAAAPSPSPSPSPDFPTKRPSPHSLSLSPEAPPPSRKEPPHRPLPPLAPRPTSNFAGTGAGAGAPNEPIPGKCPDMCPESERQERERIGDLDRFERVDGDRNQTLVTLAVKKYTRTPDKDPILIRPLPVLRVTMDYLLGLLQRFYTQDLLGLYNFLWDRLRAVRMDLRMQHIFNLEAIVMHEQMIRLHILVMHELCEFPKGEGFVEGFDAHLNIEQMNKAFSELFQMYEDHRRRGEPLATEPEFRGYYALLKLDQHPGFAVEPSDLSVQLASMSPGMRNSPDMIFARKVARMYKLPNYIGFFKLAAKATYLQACLMHAQFSKVRSQALAALYSGLRPSQGIPLSQLRKWLGMEKQEASDFVSYHGFSIKSFEEAYVVKESEFLNKDQDYEIHRSRLVESKRSGRIIDDVVSPNKEAPRFATQSPELQIDATETPAEIVEEEMPDYDDGEEPVLSSPIPAAAETPAAPAFSSPKGFFNWMPNTFLIPSPSRTPSQTPNRTPSQPPSPSPIETPSRPPMQPAEKLFEISVTPVASVQVSMVTEKTSTGKRTRSDDYEEQDHSPKRQEIAGPGLEPSPVETVSLEELEKQEQQARLEEERIKLEEANAGRARLWFRRWKRNADAIRERNRLRKQRAEAALSTMSFGFPIQQGRQYASRIGTERIDKQDLNRLRSHRLSLLDSMWKFMDVSGVVSPVLRAKNPRARSIFWKLVFCAGDGSAKKRGSDLPAQWLRSKLLGDDALSCYVSSNYDDGVSCHCITKEIGLEKSFKPSVDGATAVVFLVDESTPITRSRSRLHSLVESLGNPTPLLVFSSGVRSGEGDASRRPPPEEELALLLQLHKLDVSSWIVLSVTGKSSSGFYCSETLARGLDWLATLAPTQPELHGVDLRDLVVEKLASTLELLREEREAIPGDYIQAFNAAIRDAAVEVTRAAAASPRHWPPPELAASEERSDDPDTPFVGWNSPTSLQPIFDALELCRLPDFPRIPGESASIRGLFPGVSAEIILDGVRAQFKLVRDSLEVYLSRLGYEKPDRAAAAVLEGAVRLEWSDAGCRIVPNWRRVFQGVFRMKMMRLNSEPPPTVYLLQQLRRKPSFEDEVADYETLATRLRDGNVPDSIQEQVISFVERFNQQYARQIDATEMESEALLGDTAGDDPMQDDGMIRHELLCVRAGEDRELLSLVSRARDEEEPVLPETEAEKRLNELVAKLSERLDDNTQAAATDLEEIPRLWATDCRELVVVAPEVGVDVETATSPESSSSDSYGTFNKLLRSCHKAQTLVTEKLSSYFGVYG